MTKYRVLSSDTARSFWQPAPAGGFVVVTASPQEVPGLAFSTGVQVLPPGGRVRPHAHEIQHEVIVVLAGKGLAVVEGERFAIDPGTTLVLPPGVRHELINEGEEELRFTWTVSPPGLEDFFESIGRVRRQGDPSPESFERPAGDEIDGRHGLVKIGLQLLPE